MVFGIWVRPLVFFSGFPCFLGILFLQSSLLEFLRSTLEGVNANNEERNMEAVIGISLFLNDPTSCDKPMSKFLARVPAYVYLTSDGPLPSPTSRRFVILLRRVLVVLARSIYLS